METRYWFFLKPPNRHDSRRNARPDTRCDADPTERDTGSVAVVVLATGLAWTLAMVLAVGPIVRSLADRQHAQSAADAAALGAVLTDCSAASRLAARNAATLVSCDRSPDPSGIGSVASVVVKVGDASATAQASTGP